ncbi:hypothetical protein EDD11_007136 [Mortierella claussenii]|nr:hypothetical protein EDD11_007136 [Mortierella claussenii]
MVPTQDASAPSTQPLKSFQDLLAWQPGQDEYNVAHTPLHPRPVSLSRAGPRPQYPQGGGDSDDASKEELETAESRSLSGLQRQDLKDCQVIVCHDMAGGTVITEWIQGILETDEMVSGPGQTFVNDQGEDIVDRQWYSRVYADKLVEMAMYYGFDGWFINIESPLRGGRDQANQMVGFLRYLKDQLKKKIGSGGDGGRGQLIWYDSVSSVTGRVAWQNRLSPENYRFFEQSDGIFTNYTWKEKSVSESVALAGPRNRDVYTGIDIWGRNTFGGGGYTTYKALEVIQREGTSCAIFAPAWTYQSLGQEEFFTNDRLFWTGFNGAGLHAESLPLSAFQNASCRLLSGDLGRKPEEEGGEDESDGDGDVGGGSGGSGDGIGNQDKGRDKNKQDNKAFLPVSAYIPARPSGCLTWFYSNFDRGFGKGFWKVSDKPWSHLSHQSLAPSMTKEIFVLKHEWMAQEALLEESKVLRWILSPEEAYNGGTSLMIQEFTISTTSCPSSLSSSSSYLSASPTLRALVTTEELGGVPLINRTRSSVPKTIMVPLYNTQISLLQAHNSAVELIFKPWQEDIQVGVHLGMVATTSGLSTEQQQQRDGSHARLTARQLSPDEFLTVLRHEAKGLLSKHELLQGQSSTQVQPFNGPVGLITLDDGTESPIPTRKTVLAIQRPLSTTQAVPELTGGYRLHSLETLTGGWKRLTLYLSSLFDFNTEQMDGASIVLSQLGITATYQEQQELDTTVQETKEIRTGTLASLGKEESRVLVSVGSLGVVPTWSAQYKSSSIQSVWTTENRLVVIEQPSVDQSCQSQHGQQQVLDAVVELGKSMEKDKKQIWVSVSSTVLWNVSYPNIGLGLCSDTVNTTAADSPGLLAEETFIPTSDYSHYCIYISMEPTPASKNPFPSKTLQLVGTAFTTRYRVSNFELLLDEGPSIVENSKDGDVFGLMAMEHDSTTNLPSLAPDKQISSLTKALERAGREIWVWVQGVRRDGRADEMQHWAHVKIV